MKSNLWFFAICLGLGSINIRAHPATMSPADFQAKLWASSCMACHGTDGKAEGVGRTIAARNADELYNLLLSHKTGEKTGTVMNQHARGYSDQQLKRIADYFSRVR